MENLIYTLKASKAASGTRKLAILGVVASGDLEVLLERTLSADECRVEIATTAHGFGAVWQDVVHDFVDGHGTGGLRISINDGGARPDTVLLRLAQGVKLIEEKE
ncbi:malonate decarboxylase acyl carrier protein [Achromobacter aloeverae]